MILLRILMLPFSILYGTIAGIRNFLFNKGVKKTHIITGKSIVIGNLSMGGTGKSPHTLYLWELIKQTHQVAILSRGYGRKTKGLREVQATDQAVNVGDEPLMFKKRTQADALVVVAEKRSEGVNFIQSKCADAVILLDDAYQHRKVTAGFTILLTDYNRPFYNDFVVPAGTLREFRCGKHRANCLIVTKCPENLSSSEKEMVKKKLNVQHNNVFFSRIHYGKQIAFGKEIQEPLKILLVTGIANPKPLEAYLKRFCEVELLQFPDHHNFSEEDLLKIHTKFDTFTSENTRIVTTEKDFVRLDTLLTVEQKKQYPWYYQAITIEMDEQEKFNALINNYVDTI